MPFKKHISAHGTIHQSAVEAAFASRNIPKGFDAYDQDLPVQYTCPEGESRTGRSDMLDTVFAILIEVKDKSLNARKNKTMADRGIARLEDQIAEGWIKRDSPKHRLEILKTVWNHAAAQIAAKQRACFAAGYVYLLVFAQSPDAATLKLLDKYGILWIQEKSPEWRQFMNWRTLQSIPGITVQSLPIQDRLITYHKSGTLLA